LHKISAVIRFPRYFYCAVPLNHLEKMHKNPLMYALSIPYIGTLSCCTPITALCTKAHETDGITMRFLAQNIKQFRQQ